MVTADEGRRGGRSIPLKHTTDIAVQQCPSVEKVFVYQRTGADVPYGVKVGCSCCLALCFRYGCVFSQLTVATRNPILITFCAHFFL